MYSRLRLPVLLFVMLAGVVSSGWYALQRAAESEQRRFLELTTQQMAIRLESCVAARTLVLQQAAQSVAYQPFSDRVEFARHARPIVDSHPDFLAINWVDVDGVIREVYPLEANQAAVGLQLYEHPNKTVREALAAASEQGVVSFSAPINLAQGGVGIAGYAAVVSGSRLQGYVNGALRLRPLFERCLGGEKGALGRVQLGYQGNWVFDNQAVSVTAFSGTLPITIGGHGWTLTYRPLLDLRSQRLQRLRLAFFVVGLLLCLATSVGIFWLRREQTALTTSEQRYRQLVDNARDAIFVAQDGKVLFPNPETSLLTGYSRTELDGAEMAGMIAPEHREMVVRNHLRRLGGESPPASYRFQFLHRDGHKVWVDLSAVLIEWEGRPATLNTLRDISKIEDLERKVQRAEKLESVGRLAGGIAHDFNNLLMGIQGYADLLKDDIQGNPDVLEMIDAITVQVNSGSKLTARLLGFARGGRYQVTVLELDKLVVRGLQLFSRARRTLDVHTEIAEGDFRVSADADQIDQVLLNLYMNAAEAMGDHGTLRVTVQRVEITDGQPSGADLAPGTYVSLKVIDDGPGLDAETRAHLFEPFFTTKAKGKGSGLGLASAYGIVRNHGGTIDVSSEPGEGATFEVLLPVSTEPIRKPDGVKEEIRLGSETVLLVDDEETVLSVAQRNLEGLGYRVICAGSGSEAVEIFGRQAEEIDLVMLDMVMPGMSGPQVYEKIARRDNGTRFLFFSGYSPGHKLEEVLEKECTAFIQKPFVTASLSVKLRLLLDAHDPGTGTT